MKRPTEHIPNVEDDLTRSRHLAAIMLDEPEGGILLAGLLLALAYIVWLVAMLLVAPQKFNMYVGMTATHVLFGRAAGMSFGYALELGHRDVIPINMISETVLVLVFYPLFVFGMNQLLIFGWLKNMTDRIQRLAEANHATIRRYGIPGLLVFVCFPFWMTGPMVGCIIGYLMGLRPWLNMLVVLGGTYVAMFGWAVTLRMLHERVAAYNAFAPMLLVVLFVLIAVAAFYLEKHARHHDDDESDS